MSNERQTTGLSPSPVLDNWIKQIQHPESENQPLVLSIDGTVIEEIPLKGNVAENKDRLKEQVKSGLLKAPPKKRRKLPPGS